jgi:G2/mitotic-specific cyclin 2
MWPETLYVTVGIIDKTLTHWTNFQKSDLQCLGITALHIAGKYEEIYPPELKTILKVIDNAVTREQVCNLEFQILQKLNFDMVWPSILRFMERFSIIAGFNKEQTMIAQMWCDFMLLDMSMLKKKPSLLGAVAVYATNMITTRNRPCWNNNLKKCSHGITEETIKPLAKQLFYFIKKLETSSLKTIFRKYELEAYLGVIRVVSRIQMPQASQS